jgi:Flp pilus assembly protein TadD
MENALRSADMQHDGSSPGADSEVVLGNDLFARGDLEGALERYQAALSVDPAHARAHYNLGVVLHRLRRLDEAMRHYAEATRARPAWANAWVNWGNVRKDLGDLGEAEKLYARALDADPRDVHALNNLGSIAQERGDVEAAEALYASAAEADPRFADARYNLALLELRRGDFARGWDDYELRFHTQPPAASLAPPSLPAAGAQDLVPGRRIAIRREQGLGDQLLFSTLLPDLRYRGVEVVVEVDERLVGAYRRSITDCEFTAAPASVEALAHCNVQLPMGSLGRYLRRAREDFAEQPRKLLVPDRTRLDATRRALGSGGRRIGISWRSFQPPGRKHTEERKSAPLEAFARIAAPGLELVDLQYGDVAAERAAFDAHHPGLRRDIAGLDRLNDLEGVLAALAACDLVITTSNVTAHLAGVLGHPAWLLYLEANPPFHYWMPDTNGRSLWYPSVEVMTHRSWKTWDAVFEALARRVHGDVSA